MRSRLATRSVRLVLAAAATAALAATTACNAEDTSDAGSTASSSASASSPSSAEAGSGSGSSGGGSSATGGSRSSGSDSSGSGGSGSGGSSDKAADTDDAKKDGYGQACGTNDLTFTAGEQSQAGGYLLVTAKAKSGITCYLEGVAPSVAFGSAVDSHASNAEQAVSDTLKLSGSTAAYAGISPKSTNADTGAEYGQLIVAVAGDEDGAISLKISDTVVDKPIATNWHAAPADAVPFTS